VVELSAAEQTAFEVARAQLGRGDERPRLSGALVLAARALARGNAAGRRGAAELPALRAALAEGLSYDPAPTQFWLTVDPDPASLRRALESALTRGLGSTRVGVGAALAGGALQVVVLAAVRHARLDPVARDLVREGSVLVSGSLGPGLTGARVYVTEPSGRAREVAASGGGAAFRAPLRLAEPGPFLLEVVAQGAGGPLVVALLAVRVGEVPLGAPDLAAPPVREGRDPEEQVLDALNALRVRSGLAQLSRSVVLDGVARRHSEAMRRAGRIGHAVPGSPSTGERVDAARIGYRVVRENVARGPSALAAQAAAAESPAHLANILDPAVREVGVGVAQDAEAAFLTEIFVQPAAVDEGPLTLDARVREAIWRERARRGLPPLTADPFLDAIAREGAAALRDSDADPRASPALASAALARRQLAADDVYVAAAPEEAVRSANLPDPRYRRVGVGVVQAASRRFGPGRLFIAVVYSD
jgi:uncharacterized protein YkwD